jgi:hypothetical protein
MNMQFEKLVNLIKESSFSQIELTPYTTFDEIRNAKTIKTYRSSARNNSTYRFGYHVGSKKQALIRADFMLNDEEKYNEYFLFELMLNVNRVYPELEMDDGSDHGASYGKDLKDNYDIIVYKNTGEGTIEDENLSLIILNPDVIISTQLVKTLTPEYLFSLHDKLYS